jgi:single-stranded-DNA-specific exonuclease
VRGVSGKNWIIDPRYNILTRNILQISREFNDYWSPQKRLRDLAQQLKKFYDQGAKVGIIGDYDVDGVSATALVSTFMERVNWPCEVIIPNRFTDGYGPSINIVDRLLAKGAEVILTLDSGTTAYDIQEYLEKKSIPMFIIDHHNIERDLNSPYFINSRQWKDNSFENLCAAGLSFFVFRELNELLGKPVEMNDFLDVVAVATVCDVMPLAGINRWLVYEGIKKFNTNPWPGLAAIRKEEASVDFFGFVIGPHINAAGRLKTAAIALNLLRSKDPKETKKLALKLILVNNERREMQRVILEDIQKNLKNDQGGVFVYSERWHEGIIGIIAGRLKDQYHKPSGVFNKKDNILKGSLRAPVGFNIGEFLRVAKEKKLLIKGGGHSCAGGCSLYQENWEKFLELFEQTVAKCHMPRVIPVEAILALENIDEKLIAKLESLEPFGAANPKPVFLLTKVTLKKVKTLETGEIWSLEQLGRTKSIFVYRESHLVENLRDGTCNLLFQLEKFNNKPQIRILDLCFDLEASLVFKEKSK